MRTTILTILTVIIFAASVQAETFCQTINRTRQVQNAGMVAKSMTKLSASKGVKYKTTAKEVVNTIKNFCKNDPYASEDAAINHLIQIVDVMAAAGV